MKLLVCGKGGAGKSTLSALLAGSLAAAGRRVLVLDADVSNVALHRHLGLDAPPDLTGFFAASPALPRLMRETRRTGVPPGEPLLGRFTLDALPEGYAATRGRLSLIRAGKIADATQYGKGRWAAIARQFLAGLTLAGSDRVIVDADAGVEMLVRGLAAFCDALLAVIGPTRDAAALAAHAARLAAPVPAFGVINRADGAAADALRAALPPDFPLLGAIPDDPALAAASLAGRALPSGGEAVAALRDALEARRYLRPAADPG